ncbi:ATP-binding protein [Streptomyces sediminimaris]|uniref:ATP-binding protein n=1 Tax=Streptomyces sediminimaris TaxID=3383721 RepID=UPI00399969FD
MPEPTSLADNKVMSRMRQLLAARGLDLPAGPIDDDPTPDEPGHPEYHRRQRIAVALSRWETATPYRYQQATATHPQVTAWADRAVADPRTAGILLLTGPFGTGKTHQAYGALRRIAEAAVDNYAIVAMTAPDMYALLRPGGSDHGIQHEIKRLGSIPLLLIDDLGTEKISEFTEEATYRLLNERYVESRPLIITTNLPARAPGQVDLLDKLGDRIVSRLAESAVIVPFSGTDRRRDRS